MQVLIFYVTHDPRYNKFIDFGAPQDMTTKNKKVLIQCVRATLLI